MFTIPGFSIHKKIYESANSRIYRATRQKDKQDLIIKVLRDDYPTPAELIRFRREYEIIRELNIPGVIKAHELIKVGNALFMVLEEFGGRALSQLLENDRISMDTRLDIALKTAEALALVHGKDVIHKDLTPSNIVYNQETGALKIIDFGLSTRLSRENPRVAHVNSIEGTLAYISPEQTGRMNRTVDFRTDFYSLGATLYELFTGQKPFQEKDAMALIHCHLARYPDPPHLINPELSRTLSRIIMKLMSKDPEDRYRGAWGIVEDIRHCREAWRANNCIPDFDPARHDVSDRFRLSEKLYGREQESDMLRKAFERVEAGAREMMLVTGYSGIGKSALIREIYKPISKTRGHFITGKFDQMQRNVPFSAISVAFGELVRQILAEGDSQLEQWKELLFEVLGPNGQVVIDVIPEMELLIGPQEPVLELETMEAVNRFNMVFQKFLRVFCGEDHPLVMFLDDLQWADSASMQLIKLMVADNRLSNFFLIAAYRDHEVSPRHPLAMTLEELRALDVKINTIALGNLKRKHVVRLLADSLYRSPEEVKDLAKTALAKTDGNPFFLSQFLETLYYRGLLYFEPPQSNDPGGWCWDVEEIQALSFTDNVVDLVISKLRELPEATRRAARLAACVGNRFDLNTLSLIHGKDGAQTYEDLLPALRARLILPNSDLKTLDAEVVDAPLVYTEFYFLHDRVQQGAYALIEYKEREKVHLRIARRLRDGIIETGRSELLFEILSHFNRARDLISDEAERNALARMNLEAAQRAREATAVSSYRSYLIEGMAFLHDDAWEKDYPATLEFYRRRAEAEYLYGDFDTAQSFANQALSRARSATEKAEIYDLLVIQLSVKGDFAAAIEEGRKALALLNQPLPEAGIDKAFEAELGQVKEALGDRQIASLIDLPEMSDGGIRAAVKLLANLNAPAYTVDGMLFMLVVTRIVNLSLRHGNMSESALGYSAYAVVAGSVLGDYRAGQEFFLLAMKLSERFNDLSQKCHAAEMGIGCVHHWTRPLKESESVARVGLKAGLDSGSFQYSGYILYLMTNNAFAQGKPLNTLLQEWPDFSIFAKNQSETTLDLLEGLKLLVLNLCELTATADTFADGNISEEEFIENRKAINFFMNICQYQIFKGQVLFLYGNYEAALTVLNEASETLHTAAGTITVAEHVFYHSLTMLALCTEATSNQREAYLEKVAANQEQIKTWKETCPANFEHKYLLVEAECARINGEFERAVTLYEQAAQSARDHDFIQCEGLAHELAASFWRSRGNVKFERIYLREAHHCYLHWGAKRKVHAMEQAHGFLLEGRENHKDNLGSITSGTSGRNLSQQLDLESVFKASRTISGEIVLSDLLRKMMVILIENAGAQKGVLCLNQGNRWLVQAEGTVDVETIQVMQNVLVRKSDTIPISVVNYVTKTGEIVLLKNACQEGMFMTDPYIVKHGIRSILCIPILYQGKLSGVLYLENNLVTAAFTTDHQEVLQMLSSQAAVSIQNAYLYANLERLVAERTAKLRTTLTQLEEKHNQLQHTQAQLVHSEKMAALGTLTAGVAHEINNPVNFTQNGAQNLEHHLKALKTLLVDLATEEGETDPEVLQLFEEKFSPLFGSLSTILSGTKRIEAIVRSLRTFSRLDEAEQKTTSVVSGLQSTLGLVGTNYDDRVIFETHYEVDPLLECWPAQLNQVFMNLIVNACQAIVSKQESMGRNAAGRLIITTKADKDWLLVSFCDDGCGIPKAMLNKIFDPFFTTKDVGEGTGLGLSISFGIIERHGGSITAVSEEGAGSVVTVRLPLSGTIGETPADLQRESAEIKA